MKYVPIWKRFFQRTKDFYQN